MTQNLFLEVADNIFQIAINIKNREILNFLQEKYLTITTNKKPACLIKIKNSQKIFVKIISFRRIEIHFPNKIINNENQSYKKSLYQLNRIIQSMINYIAIRKKIYILHASGFVKKNKAFVFAGPSGIGKTTLIKKVPKRMVIGEDEVVLKKDNNEWNAYFSPFKKEYANSNYRKIPLNGIYFLFKGKKNSIQKVTKFEGLKRLISNHISFPTSLKKIRKINELINVYYSYHQKKDSLNIKRERRKYAKLLSAYALEIVKTIPTYIFYCTKNTSPDSYF